MAEDQPEDAAATAPPPTLTQPPSAPRRQVSNISMPNTQSGIFGTSSNMINSIVGAGIIGIPYAIANSGLVVGVLIFFLVAYLTDKSLRMIVELASFHPKLHTLGVYTYEDLFRIPFGRGGAAFVSTNMFILAYGAMVSYLLLIKDTVPTVLGLSEAGKGTFWERELTMVITSLLIVLPLSMLRDMASLAKTSLLSVLADVFLTGFVVVYSPIKSSVSDAGGFGQVLKDNWVNGKVFIGLGVLSFAMACQHSAFIVSNSLADKTPTRWSMVTFRSITTATILCLLLGITGYLGFLDETQGNILNNFASDSVMANAGRGLLAVTMFFTYPMECFVARHVVIAWFFNGDLDGNTIGPNAEVVPGPKFCGIFGRRHFVTFVIYLTTLAPALILDDLGPVLSITGALGASCLAYIGTGLVYLGINGDDFLVYCQTMLENHGYKVDKNPKPGEVELPMVGDATATMSVPTSNGSATNNGSTPTLPTGMKPWWWYLGGFPVWTAIASSGGIGSRNFLGQLNEGQSEDELNDVDLNAEDESNVIGPRKRDYYIAMFMIVFGVVAAVFGVASNIYVQVNNVFYTPH